MRTIVVSNSKFGSRLVSPYGLARLIKENKVQVVLNYKGNKPQYQFKKELCKR